jgi:hypothetical protein
MITTGTSLRHICPQRRLLPPTRAWREILNAISHKDDEHLLETSQAFNYVAMIPLMLKQLAHP